jgi:putative transposase
VDQLLGTTGACRLTGRSRATHYRRLKPMHGPRRKPGGNPATRLDDAERAAVLGRGEYADLSPGQVYHRELDQGRYHCSERTMYRILAEHRQVRERRAQARHPARKKPELLADGPTQIWSWDITKLRGPAKGTWYQAYVLIDIYSRTWWATWSPTASAPSSPKH